MTRRILLSLAAILLISLPVLSQEASDSAHHSRKTIRITGKVGEEGKFILCDQHHLTLKVSNPEFLRENAGRRVLAKAQWTPAGDGVTITSVKLIQEQAASYNPSDSAFRR